MLVQYDEEYFVDVSKDMANFLYQIMNSNIDIPPADLIVVRFKYGDGEYLGLLKMNYKSLYTHRTLSLEEGKNTNEIIRHKSILPPESQKLSEAAIICLDDLTVQVVEKKSVRPMACPQCGKCAEACENGAITQNAKGVYMVNRKLCTGCGKCAAKCPSHVIV